ncbi:Serine/threonine-protein kinase tel1 [Hypoxylon texense]
MEADHIDKLLERYLHLLHEYTSLREQLSSLQTAMYQNIARANFAAERGVRFGQDYYDERMQASRRVAITITDDGGQDVPVFTVAAAAGGRQMSRSKTEKGVAAEDENTPSVDDQEEEEEKREDTSSTKKNTKKQQQQQQQQQQQKDPLRWFGLLTPLPLRQAQAQSVEAVEQAVPQLVSVSAQMAQVEIEIRRARKRRAKAEAAAAKEEEGEKGKGQGKQQQREIGTGTEIAA